MDQIQTRPASGVVTGRITVQINRTRPVQARTRPAHVKLAWFVLKVKFNQSSLRLTPGSFSGLRFYSLNGTPKDSRAVCAGRCCVPTMFGCMPMSFQMRRAVAFI